jgi:hypothetical protein
MLAVLSSALSTTWTATETVCQLHCYAVSLFCLSFTTMTACATDQFYLSFCSHKRWCVICVTTEFLCFVYRVMTMTVHEIDHFFYVSVLVRSFRSLFHGVIVVMLSFTVKYMLEQQIFIYDSYVRKNSYKFCKRSFAISILVFVFQLC